MSKTDHRPTYEALERQLANLKKENATLHRTQRRLAQVGSFAASVIDQVADGLCVWHEMDRYPYVWVSVWNEKMVEITGYTKQDVNRDGWYQTIFRDADVAARAKDRMDRIWNGEDLESEEWEVTRKDGSKRLIHISMSLIEGEGNVPYVLACMHDVSESRETLNALQETEERFRNIAESVQSVFWLRLPGRMLYVNPAYETLWGKSCRSLYEDPTSFMDVVHPEDIGRVRKAVQAEQRNGRGGLDLKFRIIRPSGGIRWIHARSFPVQSEGYENRTVGIARDVTEVEESKEAIRRARDHLEVQVRERTAELNNRREQLETANRRLYRENAKRRRLSEKLVDLIESERNEICMSLHENMAQSMAILGIQLDYIQGRIGNGPDDLVHMVEKAKVLVGTVIDDMKRLSQGIGSDVLTHLGLVPALRSLMQQLDAEKGGKIRKELSVSAEVENRLNSRKRLALFRIAQEALTNIKKHAEATRVRLDLVGGEHDIRLMIEDDGSGFDPEAVKTVSHGLLIMEERSEQCGGELFVESDERRGTSVMAKIPVDGDGTEPSISPSYVSKMVTKGR